MRLRGNEPERTASTALRVQQMTGRCAGRAPAALAGSGAKGGMPGSGVRRCRVSALACRMVGRCAFRS
ncbi:hypothetical protein EGT86_37450 [Burkholderia pseudomallei]|nr:hypothetical protein EGT86_37450 [Burkholderia pseudomallei]